MVHPVNQLRKGGTVEAVVEIADIVTREEYEDLLVRIQRIESALEVDDLDAAIDELDGEPVAEDPDPDPEPEPEPEKKSRAKRKPEGQDPLGLVPEPEGDDS